MTAAEYRESIISYLQNHEGAMAIDVSRALKINSTQKTACMLKQMFLENKIHRTTGKYGFAYYTSAQKVRKTVSRDAEIIQIADRICKMRGYVFSRDVMYAIREATPEKALTTKFISKFLSTCPRYEYDEKHSTSNYNAYKLRGEGPDE